MQIPLWLLVVVPIGMAIAIALGYFLDYLLADDPEAFFNKNACMILEQYMLACWAYWGVAGEGGRPLRMAVYGAGAHTRWLHDLVCGEDIQGPVIVAVLDDRPQPEKSFWGHVPVKPEQLNTAEIDTIVISSDTRWKEMSRRCETLLGRSVKRIHIYEGLPPGPYPKYG